MADKINRTELVELLAGNLGISKTQAERFLNGFVEVVTEQLIRKTEVNITGFGSFSIRKRQARQGINPKTGEKMAIKASTSVGFKVGKKLKTSVQGKAQ